MERFKTQIENIAQASPVTYVTADSNSADRDVKKQAQMNPVVKRDLDSLSTVSYTHLDVYKR